MKGIYTLCLLLLGVNDMAAQFDTLLHKPYAERIVPLYKFYRANHALNDAKKIQYRIDSLRKFAIDNSDKDLEIETHFAEALSYHYECYQEDKKAIAYLGKVVEMAKENDYEVILPKVYRRMAEIYWSDFNEYELAFEHYYKMLESQREFTSESCPDFAQNYSAIGEAFFFFQDYHQCEQNMLLCLQTSRNEFADKSRNKARNALGLCFQEEGQLDSAAYYFNQVIQSKEPFKLDDWIGIAKGNLGYNKMLQSNFIDAIPLLRANVESAIQLKEPELAVTQLARMATCYMKLNQTASVDSILREAHRFALEVNKLKRYHDLYPVMAQWYLMKGNSREAKIYFDSAFVVKDSLDKEFNAIQLARVNQKVEQQKALVLNHEKNKRTSQRNFLLIFLALLVVGAVYVYFDQRKKFLQKQMVADQQLTQFTQSITEKTQLIEELQNQVGVQLDEEAITQLHQSTILTDADWERFRNLFDKVHKGFFVRLKHRLPDLSPAEIRFLTLTKLKLSNKEMASTLGVSPESIRVAKHRLIKKLDGNMDGGLEELVQSI
jgi:tetratricopeptide (TPR) repeat protein